MFEKFSVTVQNVVLWHERNFPYAMLYVMVYLRGSWNYLECNCFRAWFWRVNSKSI
jgi:hypothetical protein